MGERSGEHGAWPPLQSEELIYGLAVFAENGEIDNLAGFSRQIAERLATTLRPLRAGKNRPRLRAGAGSGDHVGRQTLERLETKDAVRCLKRFAARDVHHHPTSTLDNCRRHHRPLDYRQELQGQAKAVGPWHDPYELHHRDRLKEGSGAGSSGPTGPPGPGRSPVRPDEPEAPCLSGHSTGPVTDCLRLVTGPRAVLTPSPTG